MAEKQKKEKRPSAEKRCIQGQKRRLRNRSDRASVMTAIRSFKESVSKKEAQEQIEANFRSVCSLVDKAVKKGVYKLNKGSRTKSRLSALI